MLMSPNPHGGVVKHDACLGIPWHVMTRFIFPFETLFLLYVVFRSDIKLLSYVKNLSLIVDKTLLKM